MPISSYYPLRQLMAQLVTVSIADAFPSSGLLLNNPQAWWFNTYRTTTLMIGLSPLRSTKPLNAPCTRTENVVDCLQPSHPPRITSGLNINFTLSPNYSFHKSSYQKSCFFWAYLYSVGTQHGNLHPAGWPIFFCRPTQGLVLATANTREKSGEVLEKCR